MTSVSQPIQFQAIWNDTNESLKPFRHNTWKKVAFNVLSVAIPIIGLARLIDYAVQVICRKIILFSSNFSETRKENAREYFKEFWSNKTGLCQRNFRPIPLKLKTADGVEISATYFKHQNSNQNTPLMLYCSPNGVLDKEMPYMNFIEAVARRSEQNPSNLCDFITFDYRGTGDSQGSAFRANDLVLDADTVLQFAKNQLQKPNHKVHIVTYSLGGGVGAKLKFLHPELTGTITNLSSYSSLKDVGNDLAIIGGYLLKAVSWDLPTIDYWPRLNGRKLAIFHPKDKVISPNCSLYPKLEKQNQTQGTEKIQLHSPYDRWFNEPNQLFHCLKLDMCTDSETGQNALEQVVDFILRDEYANLHLLYRQQAISV